MGFITNELDTTTLLTFVGLGNGFITTWYDQTGNSRNLIQTSLTAQPQIVVGGVIYTYNNKSALYFDGINDLLQTFISIYSNLDSYYVLIPSDTNYRYPANASNLNHYGPYALSGDTVNPLSAAYGSPQIYSNNNLFTGTTRNDLYNFLNQYSIVVHQSANLAGGSWNFTSTSYAILGTTSSVLNGFVQEIILFNISQSSNRQAIQNNINSYYNIY